MPPRTIIYPPRPAGKIPHQHLADLESKKTFIVQRKFRGSRNLIHRDTDGRISLFSRHGRPHIKYSCPEFLREELSGLNFLPKKEYWLDSELMYNELDGTVILYDCLHAGKYLYGINQIKRLQILSEICGQPKELAQPAIALKVSDHVWLAEYWDANFTQHFEEFLNLDHIEGLVLRNKSSFLDNFGMKEYEINWQVRCRKPGPNYQT